MSRPLFLGEQSETAPVGISQSPSPLILLSTQAGSANVATLAEIGGTGVSVTFAVFGNANLTTSGNQLQTVASPTFVVGVNETYSLQVTDSGGTYDDLTPRTLIVPDGPTGINHSPDTILTNATIFTSASTMTPIGGTSPYTWSVVSGFSGYLVVEYSAPGTTAFLLLNSAGTGNLVAGSLSGFVQCTDSSGLSTGSIPITITVSSSGTAPTGITTSPSSISIPATQAGGSTIATLTEVGGTGVSVVFSVTGNTNLVVSGSSLNLVGSPSLTPGVNQTYTLSVTDTGGTYTDPSPRTLTILGAPTGISLSSSPLTCLANTTGNTSVGLLSEIGGSGVSVVFSVTGNTNLTVSGSTLKTTGSPSFSAGVNQTYTLSVTDSGGTFTDPTPRTMIVPAGPTAIGFTGTTVPSNIPSGAFVGTLSTTGGTPPDVYTCSNSKFTVSGSTVNRSATGTLTSGIPESLNFTSTDAAGLVTDTSTNGQGPFSVSVTTPPAGTFLTTIGVSNTAGSTQTNSIIRHGVVFPEGAIPTGSTAQHCAHGTTTPLTDSNLYALNTWPDGSVRQAVMAANITSLGTSTVTDPRGNSIQGELLDIVSASGSPTGGGITLSTLTTYLTANPTTANANWSGVDNYGVTWVADALTALSGSSSWSMTAASYRGVYYTGPFMDCFCATMPLMNGSTPHPILLARFWVFVYHHGNTIQDICTDAIIENGVIGLGNISVGKYNGDYFFADLTLYQGTTIAWQRLHETTDQDLNISLGRISGQPASYASSGYLTGAGTFTFQPRHVGRILECNGQFAYIYREGATGYLSVTSPGSGYLDAKVTNTGGTAQVLAITDASGNLLAFNSYDGPTTANAIALTGTLGTITTSVGTGASITKNTTASNVCLLPAPCIVGGICQSQTTAGGTLTLNGNACYLGVGYPGKSGGSVFLYSTINNSGSTITIHGTKYGAGSTSTQSFSGPAAGNYVSCGAWDIITSVTYTGGTPSQICVGTGGLDAPTAGVFNTGSAGSPSLLNVTTGGFMAAGTWRILGQHIPMHNSLHQRTWMNGTPRNYVSFDPTYILSSRVINNYVINSVTQSNYTASAVADVSGVVGGQQNLNTYPHGTSTNFPDSIDYNPFYSQGNAAISGSCFGFSLFESTSGFGNGLSSDSIFDVQWLVCQTQTAWRDMYDRARFGAMYSPVWYRDETTGVCFDPATYPTATISNVGTSPPFAFNNSQAGGVNGNPGQLASTFNWYNYDYGHQNTKFRLGAVMSGDPFLLEALEMEGGTRWMNILDQWGHGYDRPCEPNGGGGTQVRVKAWNIKSLSHPFIHYNENAPAGITSPQSIWSSIITRFLTNPSKKTGLDDYYSSAAAGNNPQGYNKANYGNYHWLCGGPGTESSSQSFQSNFLFSSLGGLVSNQKISSIPAAMNFFEWYASTILNNINNTTDINPRFFYRLEDTQFADWEAGTYYNSYADVWAGYQLYFPSPMDDYVYGIIYPTVTGTLSATSGSSVTLTTSSAQFFSDMVGCYVADKLQQAGSIQIVSPWSVTLTGHGFANGQAIRATPINRPTFGFPSMASPLVKGVTYYAKVIDANTFQVFTDSGLTTQVHFTAVNSATLFYAGLAQITAVTQSGTTPVLSCTLNIINPFLSTALAANTNEHQWAISFPPPGPNVPQTAWPVGTTGTVNGTSPAAYYFNVLGALGMISEDASLYSQAKTAWDSLNAWGSNSGYTVNAQGVGALYITFKYR